MKTFYIPSLDGIRGLAALLVFAYHAGFTFLPGNFGVTVFFFLSGYVITTLLRMELQKAGGLSLRQFYFRRVLRIFPPLYLVMTISLLIGLATARTMSPVLIGMQAIQFTNYAQILGNADLMIPFTGPMWSLAVEEHFYLVFPAALILLSREALHR